MPACTSHPQVETAESCAECGRPFCGACLVQFQQSRLCGWCRDEVMRRMNIEPSAAGPPSATEKLIPTRNPQALIGYYLSVLSLAPCIGNIVGPVAIVLGVRGLGAVKANPNLSGKAHAIVAIVLGSITTLLYWGGFLAIFISGQRH
jgi:hypothetical protein